MRLKIRPCHVNIGIPPSPSPQGVRGSQVSASSQYVICKFGVKWLGERENLSKVVIGQNRNRVVITISVQ